MFNCSVSLTPKSVGALPGEKNKQALKQNKRWSITYIPGCASISAAAALRTELATTHMGPHGFHAHLLASHSHSICSTIHAKVGSLAISMPQPPLEGQLLFLSPCLCTNDFSETLLMAAVSHRKWVSAPLLWHVPTTQCTRYANGALGSHRCDEERVLCAENQGWPLVPAAEQESAESPIARDRPLRDSQTH